MACNVEEKEGEEENNCKIVQRGGVGTFTPGTSSLTEGFRI